jgi:hypothetical protein
VIEIRGADVSETRFRLRDPFSEKYLTKRGWTKAASFLPGDATRGDGVLTLAIDADLARKISPGTNLVLEQPASGFQELIAWPKTAAAAPEKQEEQATDEQPAAPPVPAEESVRADADTGDNKDDAASDIETDDAELTEPKEAVAEFLKAEAAATEAKPEPATEPLVLDSFEPSIMDDRLHDDARHTGAESAGKDWVPPGNDNRSSGWKPTAIAAAVCLLIGTGIGTVWGGSGERAAVRQEREAAAIQLEKQKWEFDRQLKEAQNLTSASSDKSKASDARIADLSGKSDKLAAALAERDKTIASLKKQLADADAAIEKVKNSAGDESKAAIEALDQRVNALTGELDKANDELAERDQALRDSQARLSEVQGQLTAGRETAKQEAAALNADLARQTGDLKTELEQAKQTLARRDDDLKQLQARLDDATAEIASAHEQAKSQQATENNSVSQKIDALTADIKAGEQKLAEREAALRDAQAKLSVANIQIDALKVVAKKTTEAGLEKSALSEKVASLTAELDKTSQALSDREQALSDATAKLRDIQTKLALAENQKQERLADAGNQPQSDRQDASSEDLSRLQEERDLYAKELKTMTANFSALQDEKKSLEKTVADLQAKTKGKDAGLTTADIPTKAIWGATAIDRNGAIYSLQNQISEKVAKDNVAAMCRGKSGANCEALTTYNNACFSVARFQGEDPTTDNFAYFVHKNWKTASQTALERCESMGTQCTVRFTACSPDGLSKPVSE